MSSFEHANPPPPEIDIGDHKIWITLYEAKAAASERLRDILKGPTPDLRKAIILRTLKVQNETAALKLRHLISAVKERELALGRSVEAVPAAEYVTRAIGTHSSVFDELWVQMRARIEILRQLSGEVRPNVTLGHGLSEEWEMNLTLNTVEDIQRLQVAQIMRSSFPGVTASVFGKGDLLARCGRPPHLSDQRLAQQLQKPDEGSWMAIALTHCKELEPPFLGLTIDQIDLPPDL